MPTPTATVRPIPLSEPDLGGREWDYVKACLDSGWISSAGAFVARFEAAIAATTGAAHAIAVVNGTAGLHVALLLAGVEPGDEVLVPALTFIAPVNAVRYCGAHPVFVDAEAASWQIDAAAVERFLRERCDRRDGATVNRQTGRRVRAIVPVHLLGMAADVERLRRIADAFRLRLVEDAAEAIGVRVNGRHAGTIGDVGVLSFNGNKLLTCGGGGMVLTNDAALADRARYLTTQAKDDALEYVHAAVGYNYRLTNVQAAIGLAQLERLDALIGRKRAIAARYAEALTGTGVELMPVRPGVEATWWLNTVLLPAGATRADRQAVIAALRAQGVEARPLWHPIHRLPPYRDAESAGAIAVAVDLYDRAVSLPSSPALTPEDQQRVVDVLREALERPRPQGRERVASRWGCDRHGLVH